MRTDASLLVASLVVAVSLPTAAARAQEGAPPAARPAIRELLVAVGGERRTDPRAWYSLGIEYNLAGDTAAARSAFERAIKLKDKFVAARVGLAYTYFVEKDYAGALRAAGRAVELDRDSKDYAAHRVLATVQLQQYREAAARALEEADAALAGPRPDPGLHLLKARALIGLTIPEQRIQPDLSAPAPPPDAQRDALSAASRRRLGEAAAHLAEYLRLAPAPPERDALILQLAAARHHAALDPEGAATLAPWQVSTKAVILSKPGPGYPREAGDRGVEGLVRLRAVLAADGTVRHLLVVKPLSHGLTERALDAARRIKFRPALKDGRPVSQTVYLEYNFNIY